MDRRMNAWSWLLLGALLFTNYARGFYLPGVAPTDYDVDDEVPVLVNRLRPSIIVQGEQLSSVVPYDYYRSEFHFCEPKGGAKKQAESLGAIIFGDRIFTSPYEISMLKNDTCKVLCTATYDADSAKFVNRRIRQNYAYSMFIDGLPAARPVGESNSEIPFSAAGFPLGEMSEDGNTPYLNNHFDFFIEFHITRDGKYRVVGVLVEASSRSTTLDEEGQADCDAGVDQPVVLSRSEDTNVVFTYSVMWLYSPTPWATRWDKYLHVFNPTIHWFSLINSTIIVSFLVALVVIVILRSLRKDFVQYNELDLDEDVQEDSGWKLVHGDVFRRPKDPLVLSLLLGSGAQLFCMTGSTIVFALLGFLSPSNRGSLPTVMIVTYMLSGIASGYISARAYKLFGGEKWKLNFLMTPLLVPGLIFSAFVMLNFVLIASKSSGAVPFGTMVAVVFIWLVLSVPLSGIGSYVGFKQADYKPPVRTNQIPRQIPFQQPYLRFVPGVLLAGLLPFGSIFVELYFILSSIWFNRVYYMFGFLFLCYTILIVAAASSTILLIYFTLCSENYHWTWRSFFAAGATGFYVFFYSIVFWAFRLHLGGFGSNIIYLGYSFMVSIMVFLMTGFIGFVASFFFVNAIYKAIKID